MQFKDYRIFVVNTLSFSFNPELLAAIDGYFISLI